MKRLHSALICLGLLLGATRLIAQVPLVDPDAANRETAERNYVAAMKSDLKLLASAEEAYFVDKMSYYAGVVDARNPLYSFIPSTNISINVSGGGKDGSMWAATATHSLTRTRCTWHIPDPIDCSAPPPPPPTTPKPAGANGSATQANSNQPMTPIGTTQPVALRPGESKKWEVVITPDRSNCVVSGLVEGRSGGDRRLNLLIMTDSAYRDWQQGKWAQTYYESGERSSIAFEVRVTDPGRHVMVLANPSKTDSKLAQMETQIACTEY